MWQNYNNYSCSPEPNAPCTNAGYPVYVVAAKNADDVKAAVDFARTRNIRLNIKSTGKVGDLTPSFSLTSLMQATTILYDCSYHKSMKNLDRH